MKKLLNLSAIVLAGALVFTACKKDYTCKCTANIPGTDTGSITIEAVDTTWAVTINDVKKKDAQSTCDKSSTEVSTAYSMFGGSGSCKLD